MDYRPMTIAETRQRVKDECERYKIAAAAQTQTPLNLWANVHPMEDGAFVDVQVWVSKKDIQDAV